MTLDADLVGRAYPYIYQTTLTASSMLITPATLSNGDGTVVVSAVRCTWYIGISKLIQVLN
jgi:DUF917 family protein